MVIMSERMRRIDRFVKQIEFLTTSLRLLLRRVVKYFLSGANFASKSGWPLDAKATLNKIHMRAPTKKKNPKPLNLFCRGGWMYRDFLLTNKEKLCVVEREGGGSVIVVNFPFLPPDENYLSVRFVVKDTTVISRRELNGWLAKSYVIV